MTCDDVRDRLPEHVLGTLDEDQDGPLRRHLRGCAQCRRESEGIGRGLTMVAAAAHDRTPPAEMRDRVLSVLAEEWRQDPIQRRPAQRPGAWIAAAAACAAVVAMTLWAISLRGDARENSADATSYRRLLATLGGEEFRVAALEQTGSVRIDGSVVLYDSSVEQSWGVVLVRAPDLTGSLGVTLAAEDGRTIELREAELQDGNAATWLVTSDDLHPYDRLTITAPTGEPLATAQVTDA